MEISSQTLRDYRKNVVTKSKSMRLIQCIFSKLQGRIKMYSPTLQFSFYVEKLSLLGFVNIMVQLKLFVRVCKNSETIFQ